MKNNQVPTKKEMAEMGIRADRACGYCEMYQWHSMLGEWKPKEGKCVVFPPSDTDASVSNCSFWEERKDVR